MKCPVCGKPRPGDGTAHGKCMEKLAKDQKKAEKERISGYRFASARYKKGKLPDWMYS